MVTSDPMLPHATSTARSEGFALPTSATSALRPWAARAASESLQFRESWASPSLSATVSALASTAALLVGARQSRRRFHRSWQQRPRRTFLAAGSPDTSIERVDDSSIEPVEDGGETGIQIAVRQHVKRCGVDDRTAQMLVEAPEKAVQLAMRKDFRNSPDPSLAVRQFLEQYDANQYIIEKSREFKDPADIPDYLPGEGYGRNVIPFAGFSPGRGYLGRKQAEEQMKRALEIGEIVKAQRADTLAVQEVPVPEEQLERLQELGWFDAVAGMTGCKVRVALQNVVEEHGIRWKTIEIVGSKEGAKAGALHFMSALAPRRAASAM